MISKHLLGALALTAVVHAEHELELTHTEPLSALSMGTFYIDHHNDNTCQYILYELSELTPCDKPGQYLYSRHSEITSHFDDASSVVKPHPETYFVASREGESVFAVHHGGMVHDNEMRGINFRDFGEGLFWSPVSMLWMEQSLEYQKPDSSNPISFFTRALLNQKATYDGASLKLADQWVDVEAVPYTPAEYQLACYPVSLQEFFSGDGAYLAGRAYGGVSRDVSSDPYTIDCNTSVRLDIDVLDADHHVLRSVMLSWGLVTGYSPPFGQG